LHTPAKCGFPFPCLKPPTLWEPKCKYLERIRNILKAEADFHAEQPERSTIRGFERLLGYQFHDPRNAIPVILALAEDYYEKCAAERRN